MIKLQSAPAAIELQPLRLALEAKGIECFIQNEFPPAAGDVPPIVAWPTLCILDDSRFDEAQKILHQLS